MFSVVYQVNRNDSPACFQIKLAVFGSYFRACGIGYTIVTVIFYLWYISAQAATNIWLSEWSNDPASLNGTQDIPLRNLRLSVYGGLGGAQGIVFTYY